MSKNLGGIDRTLRVAAGIALLAWGYVDRNWLGAIGLVPLLTTAIGWCPAYAPFGLKTCKT